jgi:hypothetical protein
MRTLITVLLSGFVGAITAACAFFDYPEVTLTFINTTDALLCNHNVSWPAGEADPIDARSWGCSAEVQPNGKTTWRPECGDNAPASAFDLTVVLTLASDGREIYNRTETCEAWNDAHATLVIEQRGEELVVTDSLAEDS